MTKYEHDRVVPFRDSDLTKKEQVSKMFDRISPKYDFVNRFLSAGLDVRWRKRALRELRSHKPQYILDVATGTADLAIMAYELLRPRKVVGIDISPKMLEIGRKKLLKQGLNEFIELQDGDSETINFPDASFDAVTVAFGVRNFENLDRGLAEIHRVLKPGGKLVVLEFSKPKIAGIKELYNLYVKRVAPIVGRLFAGSASAYQYLNDSVQRFPEGKEFVDILNNTGFSNTSCKSLSLGICSIYCGTR